MKYYNREIPEILKELGTNLKIGLSRKEAEVRLKKYGENSLPEAKSDTVFTIFLRQFQSPLIYILFIAALVLIFLGDIIDAGVIFFVLLFNAVLGTIQEGRAQNALKALKKMASSDALVIREGKEEVIDGKYLIPGDIILLQDGDKVPADSRIIHSNNFKVSEAALTGESEPVLKTTEVLKGDKLQSSEQKNMAFKGTYAVSGNASAVVISTGVNTVVGAISSKLKEIDTEVPLKKDIKNLSRLIIAIVLIIGAALFFTGLLYGEDPRDMFLIMIAIAVSAIPEGLPVVITLVLATGVWKMSKRNALVKRLQATEALGQARVIALDKTGTITRNELMVSRLDAGGGEYEIYGVGYEAEGEIKKKEEVMLAVHNPLIEKAAEIAGFTSKAHINYIEEEKIYKISGDPTEAAMRIFALKAGVHREKLLKDYPEVSEIPFDSNIKFHATVNKKDTGDFLSVVGAPEVLSKRSDKILDEDGNIRPINNDDKEYIAGRVYDMSEKGLRVLAMAFSEELPNDISADNLPPLVFVGLVGMSDVMREEVPEAMRRAHEAGVKLIMITGDHKITARAIAENAGIYKKGDEILLGSDLDVMSAEEISKHLPNVSVFARVTPEHKLKIIEAYKKRGEIIAMTGDGVNDALSLVAADLGVSMGKIGTEVAKEASDIVLLDDNFGSIISAMEEGRSIFKKIKKIVLYLFSTSAGEVLTITVAILIGFPLPLLAAQIIWLNMVTDGFLVAALSMDPTEKNILKEKFTKPKKWFVDKLMSVRILLMSSVMALVTLFLFSLYLPDSPDGENMKKAWTISLTVLAVFQWYNVWNVRTEKDSIFSKELFSNKFLLLAIPLVVLLQIAVVYVPFMQNIFNTTALSFNEWIMIITIGSSIILVEEVRKLIERIRSTKRSV